MGFAKGSFILKVTFAYCCCQSVLQRGVPGGMVVPVVPATGHSTVSLACFSSLTFRKWNLCLNPSLTVYCDTVMPHWHDTSTLTWDGRNDWLAFISSPTYGILWWQLEWTDRVFPKIETPASKVDWLDQTCSWNANLDFSGGTYVCLCMRGVSCVYMNMFKHALEVAAREEVEERRIRRWPALLRAPWPGDGKSICSMNFSFFSSFPGI